MFKFCVSGESAVESAVGSLWLWLRQENGSRSYAKEEPQWKQTTVEDDRWSFAQFCVSESVVHMGGSRWHKPFTNINQFNPNGDYEMGIIYLMKHKTEVQRI